MPFLDYDHEVRKVLYTTNIIESLNARFRQAAGRRGHFPTEQAAMKVLYLVVQQKTPRWREFHRPGLRLGQGPQRPDPRLRRPDHHLTTSITPQAQTRKSNTRGLSRQRLCLTFGGD
ncbi:transposase [Micromonospora sp. NBC_01796]|uniref:transposase n=1 Tax=Micromonospora sp. NBC_01796 TaxID=2975987 RepID=UPI003FA36CED